jgi:hypothetical protein
LARAILYKVAVLTGLRSDELRDVRVKIAPLTTPQYNVVSALLQAGERGLNKDELVRKSGHADARAILGRVADLDSDWMAVVQFAGKTAGRYRIG